MDLKTARIEKRMSQAELAELAGTTQTVISYLEQGERTPTPRIMRKIERALGMPIDWPGYPTRWENVAHKFLEALHEINSLQGTAEKAEFLKKAKEWIEVLEKDLPASGTPPKRRKGKKSSER